MLAPRSDADSLFKGRGATANPAGRFESLSYAADSEMPSQIDPDLDPDAFSAPRPQFYIDRARTAITYNDSPDLGFRASVNPYRGCEHGCIYCYARPGHEYLGLSAGLDFESRIFVKSEVATLLRAELNAQSWVPQTIIFSGVTDCYQPVERRLKLTRSCLDVLAECRNPVGIITKNALVTRDLEPLRELAGHGAAMVMVSITTLKPDLARLLEPRASSPAARLRAIADLAAAGIPVGVMTAPVIPGLTDEEMPAILTAAAERGATGAGYVMLRLPHGVADLFEAWLATHYPNRVARVMDRVRDMRGGERNSGQFGTRMRGEGVFADLVQRIFRTTCDRLGLNRERRSLNTAAFRRVDHAQPDLFDV